MNVPPDVLSPIDCQSCRVLSLEGGRTSTSRAALERVGRAPNASNDIENVTSRVSILALSGRQEVFPRLCKDNHSHCWHLLCDTEQILASDSFHALGLPTCELAAHKRFRAADAPVTCCVRAGSSQSTTTKKEPQSCRVTAMGGEARPSRIRRRLRVAFDMRAQLGDRAEPDRSVR